MPEDKKPRPTIIDGEKAQPAAAGADTSPRPKPQIIEPAPQPSSGGGVLKALTAGVIGGLVGAGVVYFTVPTDTSGGADAEARKQIADLQQRTAQLGEAVRARPVAAAEASPAPAAPAVDLTEVNNRLDALEKTGKDTAASLQSVTQRIEAVEQKPGIEPSKEVVAAAVAEQIAPIGDRITGLERGLGERRADARNAALSLALANFKRAVADGRPFAEELTAIENLSPEKLPVSELAAYKDKGVPSIAALRTSFEDAARVAIQRHYQKQSPDSVVGQVMARARSAVQVKPSGDGGDTVEAILGRVSSALKAGNAAGALAAAETLPATAKDEIGAWLEQVKARVAADEAVKNTDQQIIASLTKPQAAQN
ncbi:hypothetical protein JDN41_11520 [Rhodomicrobium udaipurense]|uniref:Mitochondrial inner membrane protein n=1 Tax=Rhodomicrobium udaipurense TaxID=1202716 RepID=A0A8I1GBS3_9HYPH|nr:hypothetical protein [Rhodomicrobium udaipurense]MBJ7544172.1 hypothetical protein [Rhodomicrobium udaipurense]